MEIPNLGKLCSTLSHGPRMMNPSTHLLRYVFFFPRRYMLSNVRILLISMNHILILFSKCRVFRTLDMFYMSFLTWWLVTVTKHVGISKSDAKWCNKSLFAEYFIGCSKSNVLRLWKKTGMQKKTITLSIGGFILMKSSSPVPWPGCCWNGGSIRIMRTLRCRKR